MAQLGEDPQNTNKITMLPTDDRLEARRRLHLRDITNGMSNVAESVGADLRAARLRRGEDLRGIAGSLRIKREHLEALEEGRHDKLPARTYAIGFIRSYAEHLGLDPRHVVDRYKAELDALEQAAAELVFPKLDDNRRLPRGAAIIVAMVVAVGLFGGWLLFRSADETTAGRMAPVSDQLAQDAPAPAPDISVPPSASGDTASASTTSAGDVVNPGHSVYVPGPVELAVEPTAEAEAPVAAIGAAPQAAPDVVDNSLPVLPQGAAYGTENVDGRVTIRARKDDAWIRVEDAHGRVLIERTLQAGDTYRAPGQPGVILVARDASAFELLVDGQSLGLAGPPTLVLTGKPLDAVDLLAAMPKPTPVEPQAIAEPGAAVPAGNSVQ